MKRILLSIQGILRLNPGIKKTARKIFRTVFYFVKHFPASDHNVTGFTAVSVPGTAAENECRQGRSEILFPEAVQVAVLISCDCLVVDQSEVSSRSLAGLKELALNALLGLESDEGDVVGIQHGVLDGADFDLDNAVLDSYIGNVFLFRAVSVICADFAHRLAAAGGSTSASVDFHDHAAALFTLKNYEFCHNNPFLLPETLCNKPGHEEL